MRRKQIFRVRGKMPWFDMALKFICWKINPQIHMFIVFIGGTFGRKLVLDDVIKVWPMLVTEYL
jgi:hypothetical protein